MVLSLLPGVTVYANNNRNSFIENSIIGWSSHIGDWCRIQDYCCLGEDVTVRNEFLLKNNIILLICDIVILGN